MAALQKCFKDILWHGHEFEENLKEALELSRDNEDWEKLNAIIAKTEEVLTQSKLEIQKRHPPSRVANNLNSTSSIKSGIGSFSPTSSTSHSSQQYRVNAPIPVLKGFGDIPGGDGGKSNNIPEIRGPIQKPQSDVERTQRDRQKFNKSPTKANSQAKQKWFDDTASQLKEKDPLGVFLHGLSPSTTESKLRTQFLPYGNIRDAKVFKKGPDGEQVSKAVIRFQSEETAQRLINQTFMVDGREVKVQPLFNKQRNDQKQSTSGHHSVKTSEILVETSSSRRINTSDKRNHRSDNKSNGDDKCMICKKKVDCRLLWCGHSVLCYDCGGRVTVCPKAGCNQTVEKVIKVDGNS